jgi:uncharacterized protein (TIGR02145 family)/prepilin-type N-terminal cleavage/methylation domain-containing protein
MIYSRRNQSAFTIIELLVVIVVIAILAAVTIVAYTGITQKAIASALQSDLTSAQKQLKLYYVDNGSYPEDLILQNGTTTYCPTPEDTRYCVKASPGNTFNYASEEPYSTFTLTATSGSLSYYITQDLGPVAGAPVDPDWLTIGTQTWAKANLNVGTMVTGVTAQTNNSIVEKYCSDDNSANCTTYGGLYQWDEMMQYVTTEGVQGICPTGSHIPSDNDWKILEMQLGMSQGDADATGWRGTDQGTQLKTGGTSGLNMPLAAYRGGGGFFDGLLVVTDLGSSSESDGANAWRRWIDVYSATVYRTPDVKGTGFSVRCLKN